MLKSACAAFPMAPECQRVDTPDEGFVLLVILPRVAFLLKCAIWQKAGMRKLVLQELLHPPIHPQSQGLCPSLPEGTLCVPLLLPLPIECLKSLGLFSSFISLPNFPILFLSLTQSPLLLCPFLTDKGNGGAKHVHWAGGPCMWTQDVSECCLGFPPPPSVLPRVQHP